MITHENNSEFTSVEPVCEYVDHVVMHLYSYVVTVASPISNNRLWPYPPIDVGSR